MYFSARITLGCQILENFEKANFQAFAKERFTFKI